MRKEPFGLQKRTEPEVGFGECVCSWKQLSAKRLVRVALSRALLGDLQGNVICKAEMFLAVGRDRVWGGVGCPGRKIPCSQ